MQKQFERTQIGWNFWLWWVLASTVAGVVGLVVADSLDAASTGPLVVIVAGVEGLSPHDLRHHWATTAAPNKTPIDRLQDAGGWTSLAIPLTRYIEPARIANEGVNLGNWKRPPRV